jgi:hypothetical protein
MENKGTENKLTNHFFRKLPCCLLLKARTPALFANSSPRTPRMSSNFSPSAADPSNFQPIESTFFCSQKEKCMTCSEKTHPNNFRGMKYYMAVILHTEHFQYYFIAKLLI